LACGGGRTERKNGKKKQTSRKSEMKKKMMKEGKTLLKQMKFIINARKLERASSLCPVLTIMKGGCQLSHHGD
jgi:hypothetical protein